MQYISSEIRKNWLIHANDNYRWYYLSKMISDDTIIFGNTDSKGALSRKIKTEIPFSEKRLTGQLTGLFHVAFFNTKSETEPRESVDVRIAAFRSWCFDDLYILEIQIP
jgi:hypothetical protein